MSYDPLVHNYVKGKMIGGCLGLVLGVCLIVISSCLSACQPVRPVPPVDIRPRMVPPVHLFIPTPTPQATYKCHRWRARACETILRVGEM